METSIAVIGTGNMGKGIAQLFVQSGLRVTIGSRNQNNASVLAKELGSGASADSVSNAIRSSNIIFLALPFDAIKETLLSFSDVSNKIFVDISNPISPDYKSLVVGHTTSAAEEIQSLVPSSKVVKALNTVFAGLLSKEARNGKILQTFIAADDDGAKAEVSQLVSVGGFEAVDAGPLSNSRFLEPIGEMNIHFGFFLGRGTAVAPAWMNI